MAELGGKLGDVYDTKGHLVYDKDYISQMDDQDLDSFKDEESQQVRETVGSKLGGSQGRLGSQRASRQQLAGALGSTDRQRSNKSKSSRNKRSVNAASSSHRPSIAASNTGQEISHFSASSREQASSSQQQNKKDLGSRQPSSQRRDTTHLQAAPFDPEVHYANDFYDSETDQKDKSGLSKRERQLIKAYMPGHSVAVADNGPLDPSKQYEQELMASGNQPARKKSQSRKRKR